MKNFCKRETLCLSCVRACCGCSWSCNFEPVDGWSAEKTVVDMKDTKVESYFVLACPQYISDKIYTYDDLINDIVSALSVSLRTAKNYITSENVYTTIQKLFEKKALSVAQKLYFYYLDKCIEQNELEKADEFFDRYDEIIGITALNTVPLCF